jgi:hypothetical protein
VALPLDFDQTLIFNIAEEFTMLKLFNKRQNAISKREPMDEGARDTPREEVPMSQARYANLVGLSAMLIALQSYAQIGVLIGFILTALSQPVSRPMTIGVSVVCLVIFLAAAWWRGHIEATLNYHDDT